VAILRVLIVDDEPGMRLGAARVLSRFALRLPELAEEIHFEVEEAATGEEGLAALERRAPDLLLLDHKLPGIQGLEVLERAATSGADTLTVMVTAYATIETAVAATKRGAFDFLAKPFSPEELKSTVQKAARHILLQREAKRLAEERRQVRFQFISVLAHELKAPLAGVEGYLRLLKDRVVEPGDSKYEEVLDRSLQRVEGMRKLILDLLDLTRLESGQKRRDLATLDVREVARRALDTVRPAARSQGILLPSAEGAPCLFTADPGEMEILLNNLLSNAVKYNRPGGRVSLTLRREGQALLLEVSDTGIGISPQDQGRLFQEFTRIRSEATAGISGSGLGLSIVRKIAELYGGKLALKSTPNEGSTFTIRLEEGDPTVAGKAK